MRGCEVRYNAKQNVAAILPYCSYLFYHNMIISGAFEVFHTRLSEKNPYITRSVGQLDHKKFPHLFYSQSFYPGRLKFSTEATMIASYTCMWMNSY